MFESGGNEHLSVALFNAALLALGAVPPILLIGYVRKLLVARGLRPEFLLHKSETAELARAVRMYQDVHRRLEELKHRDKRANSQLWRVLLRQHSDVSQDQAAEIEDLEVHAAHLRAMIHRLRSRPLLRLRLWVRVKSSQFAMGHALLIHITSFAVLLIAAYHIPGQAVLAQQLQSSAHSFLVWYPLDDRIVLTNAAAVGFATVAMPIFYWLSRMRLRRKYNLEFCIFTDLANADPGQPRVEDSEFGQSAQTEVGNIGPDQDWSTILGLSRSATIDEVKGAYRALIKRNHPDRVQDMSPAFRKLAESETKKINTAYREALVSAPAL
jgi:hypothetical protein